MFCVCFTDQRLLLDGGEGVEQENGKTGGVGQRESFLTKNWPLLGVTKECLGGKKECQRIDRHCGDLQGEGWKKTTPGMLITVVWENCYHLVKMEDVSSVVALANNYDSFSCVPSASPRWHFLLPTSITVSPFPLSTSLPPLFLLPQPPPLTSFLLEAMLSG